MFNWITMFRVRLYFLTSKIKIVGINARAISATIWLGRDFCWKYVRKLVVVDKQSVCVCVFSSEKYHPESFYWGGASQLPGANLSQYLSFANLRQYLLFCENFQDFFILILENY